MTTLPANDPRRIAGLSSTAVRLFGDAARALGSRQLAQADDAFVGVLALAPEHPEVLRLLGVLRLLQGRPGDAVVALQSARHARPDDALIHTNLGTALRNHGQIEESIHALRQACRLAPDLDSVWFNLGKTLKAQSLMDEARDSLEKAIACNPANHAARLALAETLKALGRIGQSTDMYRSVRGNPGVRAQAWYGLANLKTVRFDADDAAEMTTALKRPDLADEQRVQLGFALAKALEDLGRYPQAFDALAAANRHQRRLVEWDAESHTQAVRSMMAADRIAIGRGAQQLGHEIIFVISLPRSGSTLAEQILGAHPQVEGAGELSHLPDILAEETVRRAQPLHEWMTAATADDWQRLGETYLQRTERWRAHKPRSTDKGLNNWFHLAALVRMLPGAHVVLCTRDPVETVLACYRQLFAKGQNYAYDLEEIASYWRDYQAIAEHFSHHYPAIFTQTYEALIDQPERQIRRLLEACGLDFDECCLRFHEAERHVRTASAAQVRQPLRNDTARAPLYGTILDPIRDLLGIAIPPG